MDQAAVRSLTNQLAEDLAWLEQHARTQPEHAPRAGELRYASALVRNVIGPFLEGQPALPLHVAVNVMFDPTEGVKLVAPTMHDMSDPADDGAQKAVGTTL